MKAPKKLVTFLKKNPDCLKYFQFLQTQLDNDVKVYKKRIIKYKEEISSLQKQLKKALAEQSNGRNGVGKDVGNHYNNKVEGDVESEISDEDDFIFEQEQMMKEESKKKPSKPKIIAKDKTSALVKAKIRKKRLLPPPSPTYNEDSFISSSTAPIAKKRLEIDQVNNEMQSSSLMSIIEAKDSLEKEGWSILEEFELHKETINEKALVAKARSIIKSQTFSSITSCRELNKLEDALTKR